MRNLNVLNKYRIPRIRGDKNGGAFVVPHPPTGRDLRVVAGNGDGWDHVSVSLSNRTPNWTEMSFIKGLFFEDNEVAMQLHVEVKDHIDVHPNCLHLWRPHDQEIPLPPKIMV